MPPRVPSPFKPSRPALIEPIVQPFWSSEVLTVATPQSVLSFFPVPAASQGDPTRSYMSTNSFSNPKIALVRGFRLHISQDIAVPDTTGAKLKQLMEISVQYWFRFFVGVKEYLRAPVFYMSSGVGIWMAPAAAGAEAANEFLYSPLLGAPQRENYYKITRRMITLPPQQSFESDLNRSQNASGAIAGSDVRCFAIMESDIGREVM
jgi:hypothetical protein